ncbi:MAG: transporter permease [Paenibacillaceae bacterium]|jgi:putative aldouronate transport system permease protein|nr:transporter permease [Paenibacillaceae bacterium]
MGHSSVGEKIGQALIYAILILISVITLFPFIYVLMLSITPETEAINKGIVLIPDQVTAAAYKTVFGKGFGLMGAYEITLFRTLAGTLLSMLFTLLAAYTLSKKKLPGRSGLLLFVIFTMLFSGGLVPTYIIIKSLGLLDSIWVLVLPGMISVFNLIVVKGFFEGIPLEMEEAAIIDGAGEMAILFQVIMPLAMPVVATIGLFYAVGHWNSYFDAIMYINKADLMPLQVVLRKILLSAQFQQASEQGNSQNVSSIAIQMAAVIVSTVPILAVYPFVQKHFTKGVMIGAVKG